MWFLFHRKTMYCLLFFHCLIFFYGKVAMSADWSFTPDIDTIEEYNDNVLFYFNKVVIKDFITRVNSTTNILRKTENTQLNVDSIIIGEKYSKHTDLDTINTDNKISFNQQWNPKLYTTLSGMFRKDEILETELQRAGLVGVRDTRYRYGFALSGTYTLTSLFSLSVSGGETFTRYPDGPYPDMDLWQINTDLVRVINPRDSIGLFINYYDADYKDISNIKTLNSNIYWRRNLSNTTYFVFGAGYRFTWTKYIVQYLEYFIDPKTGIFIIQPVKKGETNENKGFIVNFELNQDWTDRFSMVINSGREQYNTIDARSIERNYIRTTLSYRLSEKVSSNIQFGYDKTEEEGLRGEKASYFRVSPFLTWRYTKNLSFRFGTSYEYRDTEADFFSYSKDRFKCWIGISYSHPRLLANY